MHRSEITGKQFAFFVAPVCNQLAALVMSGLKKLGATLYANHAWCCDRFSTKENETAFIPECNWCRFLPDHELLRIAERPDVVSIGTVRYESANYCRHDSNGTAVQQAAKIQLEAIQRGLIDLYIDDGDYDSVYRQLNSVQLYVKREPTKHRLTHAMTLGLCPWLPITSPVRKRQLFFSACFPYDFRKKWNRLDTMKMLLRSMKHIPNAWIGPVEETLPNSRYQATGSRQGEAYLEVLRRSRVSLSLPGQGWDTYRFWEILACGSCLLSPRSVLRNLTISPPPREGIDYLGFDSNDELLALIYDYYNRIDRLTEIAVSGQQWAINYHSDLNRAHHLLDLISMPTSGRS